MKGMSYIEQVQEVMFRANFGDGGERSLREKDMHEKSKTCGEWRKFFLHTCSCFSAIWISRPLSSLS